MILFFMQLYNCFLFMLRNQIPKPIVKKAPLYESMPAV